MAKECVIWHLSDLHLKGTCDDYIYKKITKDGPKRRLTLKKLLKDFYISNKEYQPDLIFITGDVVSNGKVYEDKLAKKNLNAFLGILESFCRKKERRIIVIPGNHDIKRSDIEALIKSGDKENNERLEGFYNYFEKHPNIITTKDGHIVEFPEYNLSVYLFNSSEELGGISKGILKSYIEIVDKLGKSKHHAIKQIRRSFGRLKTKIKNNDTLDGSCVPQETIDGLTLADNGNLKIALLHHHVCPSLIEDINAYDMLFNAGEFIENLSNIGVQLVLHGHKHEIHKSYIRGLAPLRHTRGHYEMSVICGGMLNLKHQHNISFNIIHLNKPIEGISGLVKHTLIPVKLEWDSFRIAKDRFHQLINLDFSQQIHEEVTRSGISKIKIFNDEIEKKTNAIVENFLKMNVLAKKAPYITRNLLDRILSEIKDITLPFTTTSGENMTDYANTIKDIMQNLPESVFGGFIINTMMRNIDSYKDEVLDEYDYMVTLAMKKHIKVKNLLMIPFKDKSKRYLLKIIKNISDKRSECFKDHKNELFEFKFVFLDSSFYPMNSKGLFSCHTLGTLDCFIVCNNDKKIHKMVVGELELGNCSKDGAEFPHLVINNEFIVETVVNRVLSNIYKDDACNIEQGEKYIKMARKIDIKQKGSKFESSVS